MDNSLDCPSLLGRGGDTSMAGMAIAIPGVSNISKTGDTMGKSGDIVAKNRRKWQKKTYQMG